MGPGGMIEIPEDMEGGVSRLVDMSVACRYLAAQCQVCNLPINHLLYIIYPLSRCDKGIGQKRLKCSERRIHFVILVS
jgi:hypothetical protein